MTRFPNHEICFRNSQHVVSRPHVGLYVESKLHGYVDSRFACFYLTGQLESILRKFQLAKVVLVVSKPHVFNLTGQLVLTPPECFTLAATDLLEDGGLELCKVGLSALRVEVSCNSFFKISNTFSNFVGGLIGLPHTVDL
jgi:hypothetical protein